MCAFCFVLFNISGLYLILHVSVLAGISRDSCPLVRKNWYSWKAHSTLPNLLDNSSIILYKTLPFSTLTNFLFKRNSFIYFKHFLPFILREGSGYAAQAGFKLPVFPRQSGYLGNSENMQNLELKKYEKKIK